MDKATEDKFDQRLWELDRELDEWRLDAIALGFPGTARVIRMLDEAHKALRKGDEITVRESIFRIEKTFANFSKSRQR